MRCLSARPSLFTATVRILSQEPRQLEEERPKPVPTPLPSTQPTEYCGTVIQAFFLHISLVIRTTYHFDTGLPAAELPNVPSYSDLDDVVHLAEEVEKRPIFGDTFLPTKVRCMLLVPRHRVHNQVWEGRVPSPDPMDESGHSIACPYCADPVIRGRRSSHRIHKIYCNCLSSADPLPGSRRARRMRTRYRRSLLSWWCQERWASDLALLLSTNVWDEPKQGLVPDSQ